MGLLLAIFSIILPYGNKLLAQEKEQETLIPLMGIMRNDIKEIFKDNKQGLITTNTENMLTDVQCRKWIGNRSVLQKIFTQMDECAGDSLFNIFYEDGLLIQKGAGDQLFFLGEFKTSNTELFNGLAKKQVKDLLGSPYKESDIMMVYKKELHPEICHFRRQ